MTRCSFIRPLLCWLCFASVACGADDVSVLGQFVGSSPCGPAIRRLLDVSADAKVDLLEWKLVLFEGPTGAPANYELQCKYGTATAGAAGLLGADALTVTRSGRWTTAMGTKSDSKAVVYELQGAFALLRVGYGVLHILNPDRSLMVGDGGRSYTLNETDAAEPPGNHAIALARTSGSDSYQITPLSTGPAVFGVFEGRTPYRGIVRELNRSDDPGGIKAKWRVTLYQDPDTHTPATYKVEGTLHHQPAREGKWTIVRGAATDPSATVYRLGPTATEPAIFLLKGDDNVLFFLNREREPLVGHAEFSYTLDRRE